MSAASHRPSVSAPGVGAWHRRASRPHPDSRGGTPFPQGLWTGWHTLVSVPGTDPGSPRAGRCTVRVGG